MVLYYYYCLKESMLSMYLHTIHVISDDVTCPSENQTILIILSCHDQSDCRIQCKYITYLPPGGK